MDIKATIELIPKTPIPALEKHASWVQNPTSENYYCPELELSEVRPMLEMIRDNTDILHRVSGRRVAIWYIVGKKQPKPNRPKFYEKDGVRFWDHEFCILGLLETQKGMWLFDNVIQNTGGNNGNPSND